MFERVKVGLRDQVLDSKGNLKMDFNIIGEKNQIHVLNAPSPRATVSLAIVDYLIENY